MTELHNVGLDGCPAYVNSRLSFAQGLDNTDYDALMSAIYAASRLINHAKAPISN